MVEWKNGGSSMGKVDRWLRKDGLALIAGWRRWGADAREVAQRMGVSFAQLRRWEKEHAEIGQALEVDSEAADFLVEEEVFRQALEGDKKALEIWIKYRNQKTETRNQKTEGAAGQARNNDGVDYVALADLIRGG